MTIDRYLKQEMLVRTTFRTYWLEKLSSAKQKAQLIPGFEIPRGANLDIVLPPTGGTILCFHQRSDYVAAYKHSVGLMIGILVHYHQMNDREVREVLRACQSHPDFEQSKQTAFDVLHVSKRLLEDSKKGEVTLALVTELPEVPQQAKELQSNFFPIAQLLQGWLTMPLKKKKYCTAVEFYSVNTNADPPTVALLAEAIGPMLKMAHA
jgi:hypothetical protein